MKDLSSCCKAPIVTQIADEGTGCYICTKCRKGCDVWHEEKEVRQCTECRSLSPTGACDNCGHCEYPIRCPKCLKEMDENKLFNHCRECIKENVNRYT